MEIDEPVSGDSQNPFLQDLAEIGHDPHIRPEPIQGPEKPRSVHIGPFQGFYSRFCQKVGYTTIRFGFAEKLFSYFRMLSDERETQSMGKIRGGWQMDTGQTNTAGSEFVQKA
jgi:hypothetical protein